MAITATLDEFYLLELIHMAITHRKTGVFTFRTNDEESTAEVYFENGEIVHASDGSAEGEEALVGLFFRDDGALTFTPGEKSERKTISQDSLELIIAYSDRVEEVQRIQKELPSLEVVLVRSPRPERGASQVDVTLDQWQVLSLANGHRTIRDIIHDSGKSDIIVKEMLAYLIRHGLLVDPVEVERILRQRLEKLDQFYGVCDVPELHGMLWIELVKNCLHKVEEDTLSAKYVTFEERRFRVITDTPLLCSKADVEDCYGFLKKQLMDQCAQEYGYALMRAKVTALGL